MATVIGEIQSVFTLKSPAVSPLQVVEVLAKFQNQAYTAQVPPAAPGAAPAEGAVVRGLPQYIREHRYNGKSITIRGWMPTTPAKLDGQKATLVLDNCQLQPNGDLTCRILQGDWATELPNGPIPGCDRPFLLAVSFTENE